MLAVATAAILHANNARDRESDARIGKRTVATYLSPRGVVLEFRLLLAATAVLLVAGLATRGLPLTALVVLPAVVLSLRTAARARAGLDARGWTRLLIACVGLHMLTGVLLALGLLLHTWV
jgi:1,4-dihydroxy-2-naphthoate polyprenyltransferase